MLLDEFDAWRCEQEAIKCRAPMPHFTPSRDWQEDFEMYMHLRCVDRSVQDIVIDLAWQLYMLQACNEGLIEDMEELQNQIIDVSDLVEDHQERLDELG